MSANESEPKFNDIEPNDVEMSRAYALASRSISTFLEKVKEGGAPKYMAKLSFRDPDYFERMGVDKTIYLWLDDVVYHAEEKIFSGVFFELPASLEKWHQVGERLGFEAEDVFDWMINDDGVVDGGFTIRVRRSRLQTEVEKLKYDEYVGIAKYNSISEY